MNPNPRLSETNDDAEEMEIRECEETDYYDPYQDDSGCTDYEDLHDSNRD